MTVYIDLIFFMNFIYDFLLLITVGLILKRRVRLWHYLLGAFIGAICLILLFLPITSFLLFFLKILFSILMCLCCFGFISISYTLNNITFLYMCSVILAGFLYFLNLEFSLEHSGIIFFANGFSINYVLLLIISPVILFFYYKSIKLTKRAYALYHHIEIVFENEHYKLLALLDTGNSLKDPITNKPVIIIKKNTLKGIYNIRSPMYIPFNTIKGSGLMRCYKPSFIVINNQKIYGYLVGECEYKFSDGVECILNVKLMEDNYV